MIFTTEKFESISRDILENNKKEFIRSPSEFYIEDTRVTVENNHELIRLYEEKANC